MNMPIEKTQRLLIKSTVMALLFCISSVQTVYSQTDREVASESLVFSLVYDGGTEKCDALSLDMDSLTLAIDESDCIPGVVSGDSDGSLIFTALGIEPVTCSLDSLTIDGDDNIRVVTSGGCFDADLDDDGIPNKEDPAPTDAEYNECSLADELLPPRAFVDGDRFSCRASSSISTDEQSIAVGIGADVLYMAPSIRIQGGFSVETGGAFHAIGRDASDIAL